MATMMALSPIVMSGTRNMSGGICQAPRVVVPETAENVSQVFVGAARHPVGDDHINCWEDQPYPMLL